MKVKEWNWRMDWCLVRGLSPSLEDVWKSAGEAYYKKFTKQEFEENYLCSFKSTSHGDENETDKRTD
jgi:hypothetical protein